MEDKYYLAIQTKPNNYFPINLRDLNITKGFNSDKLEQLDAFTRKFTKKEILTSIKEANLLELTENMALVLIYNEKNVIRKADVLTKDNYYDMWLYIEQNYQNKSFLNKIFNFLKNKVDNHIFFQLKNISSLTELINIINSLPYKTQRKLYFYLSEK